MNSWKIAGLIAIIIIILSVPLYLFKTAHFTSPSKTLRSDPTFVGSQKCRECHRGEYEKWQHSHHDHAMEVANDATVRADFNNVEVEFHGVASRFYRKNDKFFSFST